MTSQSHARNLTAFVLLTVAAGTARPNDELVPTAAPGNPPGGRAADHHSGNGPSPIRGFPAAAGANPVTPTVARALRARAHLPESTPVPPTLEIEVLDPNVDPQGRPAVLVNPGAGPDGLESIDIPPTVLVHRYYYTGDRSFQGPMLPGGPSVVVVNHPADGERLYLEVQMLPGAPRVVYTRRSIEYNYGVQSIILSFGAHGRPKITYRQGVSAATRARVAAAEARQAAGRFVERTGLPEAGRRTYAEAKNVAATTADRAHDVGKMAVTPVVQIIHLLPGFNLLTSTPEQRVERERDLLVRRAENLQAGSSLGSIPTNIGGAIPGR